MLYSAQILLCVAYNERVDVFSFGFTLLEIAIGDCTYIKKYFRGQACVVSRAKGGLGWRPPVPNELAVSQPDLALLFGDCVEDDFNERPSFVEICERLETCKAIIVDDEDLDDDISVENEDAFDAEFPLSVCPSIVEVNTEEMSEGELRAMIQELQARIRRQAGKISLLTRAAHSDKSDTGILAGMYIFDPDKERSVLGKGAFGTVFRMRNSTDQRVVAVKELHNLTLEDGSPNYDAMEVLLDEVSFMYVRIPWMRFALLIAVSACNARRCARWEL